ncbi:hypothetical protein [Candidatus Deianiraea vastatrix]|uniref:Uncharacterized protein n=1 Tax=Candidatus Deianiraea vastatrix TaxID=2163644 RepID=A0A5B8XI73_9RICK|nr:hypothetical protein [Candidatus Deianiraea vastatrix]QED23721.1 hypothetical protein Deia_00934 [Candidatus Deianiraea vastatrix]
MFKMIKIFIAIMMIIYVYKAIGPSNVNAFIKDTGQAIKSSLK